MLIHTFQWPDDLTSTQRGLVPVLEERARRVAASINISDAGLRLLAERLLEEDRPRGMPDRIVVDWDQGVDLAGVRRGGARVRFTWSRHEIEARQAAQERRAREARELERPAARRRGAVATPAQIRASETSFAATRAVDAAAAIDAIGEAQARRLFEDGPIASAELEALSNAAAAIDRRSEASASPFLSPAVVIVEDREFRREVLGQFVAAADPAFPGVGTVVGVAVHDAPAGEYVTIDLGAQAGALMQVARVDVTHGPDRSWTEIQTVDGRRWAPVPGETIRPGDLVELATADGRVRLARAQPNSPRAVPRSIAARDMRRDEANRHRYDANGWCAICEADPSMWCDRVVHERMSRLETEDQIARFLARPRSLERSSPPPVGNPYAPATEYPAIVVMVAQQLNRNPDEVLRGYIARSREGDGVANVRGSDLPALAELLSTRREGDRFYFIAETKLDPLAPLLPLAFKDYEDPLAKIPGTMAYALEAAKRRAAASLDLFLLIAYTIAKAAARARAGGELWLQVTTTILRAWSSAPMLLELDTAHAPFGVDTEPPADPISVRVGLLELGGDRK